MLKGPYINDKIVEYLNKGDTPEQVCKILGVPLPYIRVVQFRSQDDSGSSGGSNDDNGLEEQPKKRPRENDYNLDKRVFSQLNI